MVVVKVGNEEKNAVMESSRQCEIEIKSQSVTNMNHDIELISHWSYLVVQTFSGNYEK